MTDQDHDGPWVTIFRSRLRPEEVDDYRTMAVEMDRLARTMPGLVEIKGFTADDGERLTLVTFADRVSHDAWRDHPRHRVAKGAGRARFYQQYQLQVCRCEHTSVFDRDDRV